MPTIKHYIDPYSYLVHYSGAPGRQFKFALDGLMDRQYRQSGVDYGLLHALALRLMRMSRPSGDLRLFFWDSLD